MFQVETILHFDWDEYSVDLCSDINQLNEYLPLYAFINAHSTMDVSSQDLRMTLWFFEYALGLSEEIATRIGQYTREYLENITPPFTRALFNYVQEGKYTFCTPGHMGGSAYQKSPVGCLFYDFFGGNTLKADVSISVTELGSLLDHTGPHLEAEEYIARAFGAEQSYMVTNGTSTSNKIVGMYSAPAGSTLLIDRNCHKSLAHLLMMSDVVPLWLKPTRNALGILGGIPRREFTRDSIQQKVRDTGGAQFEPRGEHFGQHGNISIGRRNDRLQTFQVPGGMFPFHVDLADSNTYFHRKTPFCKQIYKIFLQIAPAGIKNMEVCKAGRQQREPGIQNGHAGRHPCGSAYGSAMKSNAGKQGAGSRSQPAKAHGPATVCPDELPERPDAAGKKQPARQTALH